MRRLACAIAEPARARARLGASQGALLEPRGCADRARPHQDHRGQGQGGQAVRRADDHARQARRLHAGGSRSPSCARRTSSTSCSPMSRHASRNVPAATPESSTLGPRLGDCCGDGLPRARGLRAGRLVASGNRRGRSAANGCSSSERSCWRFSSSHPHGGSWLSSQAVSSTLPNRSYSQVSRRRRAVTGVEALIGKTAVVSSPTQVRVAGEIWEVRSNRVLATGEEVVVHGVDGLDAARRLSRDARGARRGSGMSSPGRGRANPRCPFRARRSQERSCVARSTWLAVTSANGRSSRRVDVYSRPRSAGAAAVIYLWGSNHAMAAAYRGRLYVIGGTAGTEERSDPRSSGRRKLARREPDARSARAAAASRCRREGFTSSAECGAQVCSPRSPTLTTCAGRPGRRFPGRHHANTSPLRRWAGRSTRSAAGCEASTRNQTDRSSR